MLIRCAEAFETMETGFAKPIEAGTVWQVCGMDIADGGYEVAVIAQVEEGQYTDKARVRVGRISTNFDTIPPNEILGGCEECE